MPTATSTLTRSAGDRRCNSSFQALKRTLRRRLQHKVRQDRRPTYLTPQFGQPMSGNVIAIMPQRITLIIADEAEVVFGIVGDGIQMEVNARGKSLPKGQCLLSRGGETQQPRAADYVAQIRALRPDAKPTDAQRRTVRPEESG